MEIDFQDRLDTNTPLTEGELDKFLVFFRGLPTYNKEGRYAELSDVEEIVKFLRMDRTDERTPAYAKYFEAFAGKVPEDEAVKLLKTGHSTADIAATAANLFDLDGNGFISKGEFELIFETLVAHDPALKGESYEEFVKQADKNGDGKVSVSEASVWIEKVLAKNKK